MGGRNLNGMEEARSIPSASGMSFPIGPYVVPQYQGATGRSGSKPQQAGNDGSGKHMSAHAQNGTSSSSASHDHQSEMPYDYFSSVFHSKIPPISHVSCHCQESSHLSGTPSSKVTSSVDANGCFNDQNVLGSGLSYRALDVEMTGDENMMMYWSYELAK